MRRKILAFICAVVVFMLLWIIFLIPIQVGFLLLVGIVSGLLEYERLLEDATIMFWETIARFLTTLLSGYISYKIYQKISIDCGSYNTFIIGAIELKTMKITYQKTNKLKIFFKQYLKKIRARK